MQNATRVQSRREKIATMVELSERFQAALKHANSSVSDVARATGLSYQALKKVLDGKTKSQDAKNNLAIAQYLGVSSEWLSSGEGEMLAVVAPGKGNWASSESADYAGTMLRVRRVPVVGTAKLGDDGYYDEISSIPGAGDGHIEIAIDDPNAYGIRVRGQSMFPAIRDGWYVLVKPNGSPQVGEYVLLKLRDGRKMVKELLVQRHGAVEVMSVNGGERLTFELSELEGIQPVGAVVSPSQWRPD